MSALLNILTTIYLECPFPYENQLGLHNLIAGKNLLTIPIFLSVGKITMQKEYLREIGRLE